MEQAINRYTYDMVEIGTEEYFEVLVTDEMTKCFFAMTGDVNPLHTDRIYAQSVNYTDRVVYGMLTASLLSTLAGVYLPGKFSLIHSVKVEFPKPVFVGDTLSVRGQVIDKNDIFKTIEVKATITNQNNEKVCRGKMRIEVLK